MRDRTPADIGGTEDDTAIVAALSDCYSALERNLNGMRDDAPRHSALDAVRIHIARFAAAAAGNNVPPERAIVLLKRSVRALWATKNWLDTEREGLSHQLVEMLVASYYAQDAVTDNRRR